MKKFRTHSDTLRDIGREDVAEALDKKKFKEKLLGKELGKEVTKEALAQYQEDRLLNYIDNVKFKYSKQPIVEEPVTYNSTIGQFQKGNKLGALSDFKDDLKAYQVLTTPEVKPEVTKEPVVQQRVIPQEDIRETIRRKADETLVRQQKEYAKEYGVHGIASLGKPQ